MEKEKTEYKVSGDDLVKKVKEIIAEGNATKISILNEKGEKIMEFPLTIGAVGVLLAPILAAVGALAAILSNCTVVVERNKKK